VHGVIGRIAPEVRVIDVGHDFARGDVRAGGLALMRAIQYLPQGVALAVIDPTVGTERRAIAARTEWGVLIGPDNGLLAPAVAMVGGADAVVSIENPELRLPAPGSTFHGRDLFGPAAAVIASGQADFEDLGPAVDPDGLVRLMLPLVEHEESAVVGEALWVDHFGNAQLNITPEDLRLIGVEPGADIVLKIASAEFAIDWVSAYGDVEPGEGLLHIDSYGQIAVAVRDGSAVDSYPLAAGTAVTLRAGTPSLRVTPA
jgi:S-adenosylmethionine hydrolase